MENVITNLGPSRREISIIELLHEEYRKTGQNKSKLAKEIFRTLNISNGEDFGTVNESKYIERTLEGTQDAFKLSTEGIRYSDSFWNLVKRKYEELGGATRNAEMLNKNKQARAESWAREQMKNIGSQEREHIPEANQEILKLSPEFYGVGIDLKVLCNKVCT